jgi:two-component system, response regulator YesN
MYRILTVDDEKIALDAMQYIVEKNLAGRVELTVARSGREAISTTEENSFDIIFIDLKMPGIDGIEATREIRKRDRDCNIVFVTAHEVFDFAKEAIQLGVKDYLLKPIHEDAVVSLINQLIYAIEIARGHRKEQLLLREKFRNVLPVLENSFINALLLSQTAQADLNRYRDILDIDETGGYILTIELPTEGQPPDDSGSGDRFSLGFKNEDVFDPVFESIRSRHRCLISALTVNRVVVFKPCATDENEYAQRVSAIKLGEFVKRKILEQTDVSAVSIGIGRTCAGMDNVVQSYEESLKAIRCDTGSGLVHIMDLEQVSVSRPPYPIVRERQMLRNIGLGRDEDALRDYDFIHVWMTEVFSDNLEMIKTKTNELVVLLNRLLWEYCEDPEDGTADPNARLHLVSLNSVSEVQSWFRRRIKATCESIRHTKITHESELIKTVKSHVQDHYMEEITLGDVSHIVNISPHYLSKLFKDETGTTFILYVTTVRLEKAKELLKHGCFSIKEVCYRVGYSDPNYFSRLFKKHVGVPPTQFKDEEVGWLPGSGVYVVPAEPTKVARRRQKIRIGLSLASLYEDRWKRDKRAFIERAGAMNAEVITKVADNNCEKQIQQVQSLLQSDIDVLVVITQNSEKMARTVADAKALSIGVIAYCRLIMNADIDMYIAFDGIRIGELMAKTIVDSVPTGRYVIVNGAHSDYNSQMYNQGIHNILQEYVQNDRISIIAEIWANDWQPDEAQRAVERIVAQGAEIDAIICGNDTLAEAVIQVLARYGLAGTVNVTGHDADLSGFKHTLDGTQLMTVYTPFESMAEQAADYAIRLAQGEEITTNWSIFNGLKNVPYHKLMPVAVTRDNIQEIMKVSGYYTIPEPV